MNDAIFDDIDIEHVAKSKFGLAVDIKQVIARNVPVSHTTEATVFLTTKNQLFTLVSGKSRLLLGDVRKIIIRMGMKAELFLPPKGEPDYFNRIGREKFKEVFPGRGVLSSDDIAFYKTLAPYNPAMVQISEIKQGVIRKFDPDSTNDWRIAAEFSYRRIKTS
jgi:hypothetical protein